MTTDQPATTSGPSDPILPQAKIEKGRRFSLVWLIPIVAAGIAGWLAYTTISEQGPTITITFSNAVAVEAGKTKVKHKNADLGVVTKVTLSKDLQTTVITAEMDRSAEPFLDNDTRFWVVRARLSFSGVQGLETLISGAYIEMDPGSPDAQADEGDVVKTKFVGLEEPPVVRADVPGTEYTLLADQRRSITPGSPVHFRGMQVGEIVSADLSTDGKHVVFSAFVRKPFDKFVINGSSFWNASGITVTASPDFEIRTESLATVVAGGVAFDSPDARTLSATLSKAAPAKHVFILFKSDQDIVRRTADMDEIQAPETVEDTDAVSDDGGDVQAEDKPLSPEDTPVTYLVEFDTSVRGLSTGSPVEMRGLKIGEVRDFRMVANLGEDNRIDKDDIRVLVSFEMQPRATRIHLFGDRALDIEERRDLMEKLVEQGFRVKLQGNFLTGSKFLDLDFLDKDELAKFEDPLRNSLIELTEDERQLFGADVLAKVPAAPTDRQQIEQTLRTISDRLQKLQIEGLVSDARSALRAVRDLADSPDVRATLKSVRGAAEQLQPLIRKTETTVTNAGDMLSPQSQLRYDLNQALSEMRNALRSLRILADYLEQHPEALVRGKQGARF